MDTFTVVYGNYHYLLIFELCLLFLVGLLRLLQLLSRYGPGAIFRQRKLLSLTFLVLLLLLLFYSQWFSSGRPVVCVGLAMPGSLITRSLVVELSAWLRRLMEPAIWFFAVALMVAAKDSERKSAASFYQLAFFSLLALLSLEVAVIAPGGRLSPAVTLLIIVHLVFTQTLLVSAISALLIECATLAITRRSVVIKSYLAITAALFLLVTSFGWSLAQARAVRANKPLTIGAHYYSWFPENWHGGYIGGRLQPKVVAQLGEYQSDNPAVFRQHKQWAEQAGIDYFVFDWWAKRPEIGRRISRYLQEQDLWSSSATTENGPGFKFSLMYESIDLKEPGEVAYRGEEANVAFITPERAWRLKKHWEYLAKTYMKHPAYWRINNKPVLFIYASRHLVGPVGAAIREARRHVRETTGIELYLVADEVFFNVLTFSERYGLLLRQEFVPEWERLTVFDALTAYNPYDVTRPEHGGVAGASTFFGDVEQLYRRYKAISAVVGIEFFPSVLPGYNDRGVRLKEDHYVIPRGDEADCAGTFLETAIKRLGLPFVDSGQPTIVVTSWNEWNEGTQIEPTSPSPLTTVDDSPSGHDYSRGEAYQGYGQCYLQLLSRNLK